MTKPAFVFLGGGELPWIYPLAVELAAHGHVSLIQLLVSQPLKRAVSRWPFDDQPPSLEKLVWRYPPGFNGRFAPLFTGLIRRRVDALIERIADEEGTRPYVITPEPRFEPYTTHVASDRLVYLNYDDYGRYAGGVRQDPPFEAGLVKRAGTILCSSQRQCDRFRAGYPGRANAVVHFPHGVHESFLNTTRAPATAGEVCVVGALTARYDWALIEAVVEGLPRLHFTFAGEIDTRDIGPSAREWRERMRRTLERPNVTHLRGLRHRETPPVYWRSAVSWMPYDVRMPFVQSCSPLKLVDGLASGRAIVSADVPECRLYPKWIHVYGDAEHAAALLLRTMEESRRDTDAARAAAQVSFARDNTWAHRAERLVHILRGERAVAALPAKRTG